MMNKKGRRPVNKRRQRKTSSFLTKSLDDINNEIKEAYVSVTGIDKLWGTYSKVTKDDAETCFMQYKGRCVFCDKTLSYLGRHSRNSARLMWYVPLNVGGEARPDNLVVVCAECKHGYRSTRKLREDIQGLDSFADVCVELYRAVAAGADRPTINRLKNRLNIRLSDVATCMRYIIQTEVEPETPEVLIEGVNTIPDMLEDLTDGLYTEEEQASRITNRVKKVVKHKQYKVIRNVTDDLE